MADNGLSLNRSRARAKQRRQIYRSAMTAYVLLQAAAGIFAILFGKTTVQALDITAAPGIVRVMGGLLLLAAILSIPACYDPVRSRPTAIVVLLGGFVFGILCLVAGAGLFWIGVIQLILVAVLVILYSRFFASEIQSRP